MEGYDRRIVVSNQLINLGLRYRPLIVDVVDREMIAIGGIGLRVGSNCILRVQYDDRRCTHSRISRTSRRR